MIRIYRVLLVGVSLCWSVSLAAETAYVTDRLRLGMHNEADTSDRAFRVLDSGQEMEVISRNANYALVRLPDNTQGYVKAAYLVDEKPAKLIVAETEAARAQMEEELASTKSAFAGSAGRIKELESQVSELGAQLAESKGAVSQLTRDKKQFSDQLSLYRFSLPWPMVLAAALVAIVLGLVGGMWWVDYRSRRRHGGFRIY